MDKAKRILAIITIVIIVICVILTLVFGIIYANTNNPFYKSCWMASAFCMFFIPLYIWAMRMVARILRRVGEKRRKRLEMNNQSGTVDTSAKEEKTEE